MSESSDSDSNPVVMCDSCGDRNGKVDCSDCNKSFCFRCVLIASPSSASHPLIAQGIHLFFNCFERNLTFTCSDCCDRDSVGSEDSVERKSELKVESKLGERLDSIEETLKEMKESLLFINTDTDESFPQPGDQGTIPKRTFASVVSKQVVQAVSQQSSSEFCRRVREMNADTRRQQSIVVVGMPECRQSATPKQAYEHDRIQVSALLAEVGVPDPGLLDFYRLRKGEFAASAAPRKIMVNLGNIGFRNLALKVKSSLEKIRKFKKIFIEPSKSPSELQEESILKEKSRGLNIQVNGNKFEEKYASLLVKFGVRGSNVYKFTRNNRNDSWPKTGERID